MRTVEIIVPLETQGAPLLGATQDFLRVEAMEAVAVEIEVIAGEAVVNPAGGDGENHLRSTEKATQVAPSPKENMPKSKKLTGSLKDSQIRL